MVTSRDAAFSVLSKIERDNSYSNLVLGSMLRETKMQRQDTLLAHRIVKTVIERKITTDYNLSIYLTQPLKKLKPQVLTVLRMGACQLLFMDKIPASAAINESVKLCKSHGCAFASGLVNAVLRKVASNGLILPDISDRIKYLSVKYSFSEYICTKLVDYYGDEIAEKIMEKSLGDNKIYIRKNSLKTEQLTMNAEKISELSDCFLMKSGTDIASEDDFKKGLFHVQDLSSQICCAVSGAKPGQTVIDICAAPGGKTMTTGEYMNNSGKIISCDIHEHKLKLIDDTAKRLGITIIETMLRDGADESSVLPKADVILCDVPCSGFGVTGKKPEIKYKTQQEIESLPELQYRILSNSSRFLKNGGRLVYSTCTLLPEENIGVCKRFLTEHKDFVLTHIDDDIKGFRDGETLTILPDSYDCDGFFVAVFEWRV